MTSDIAVATQVGAGPRMRYTVDGWDPAYGASLELEEYLQESTADVAVDLELPAGAWHALDVRTDSPAPAAMLFVDGVRRIEARVWIDSPGDPGAVQAAPGPATEATAALCASYAAGVVCCCGQQAHLVTAELRRGLFSVAPQFGRHQVRLLTTAAHHPGRVGGA